MAETACAVRCVRRLRRVFGSLILLLITLSSAARAEEVASIDPGTAMAVTADDPCDAYAVPSAEPAWTFIGPKGTQYEWWPTPSPRPKFVFDTRRHRIIMLFDENGYPWTLDLNLEPPLWRRLLPVGDAPPLRTWQAIAYDPVGDQVVLIGGQVDYTPSDTTWVLSFAGTPRWSILNAPGEMPPAGSNSASIYDPLRDRILVFGGNLNGEPFSNGLWELRLRDSPRWRRLHPGGIDIPGIAGTVLVYDPRRDRFVVHGGWTSEYFFTSVTLAYHPSNGDGEWTWLRPSDFVHYPKAAGNGVGVYDPVWDRIIIHGGRTLYEYREGIDQLWAFDLEPDLRWFEMQPEGPQPVPRAFHAAEYDAAFHRMLLFGGASGGTVHRDLWALELPRRHYRVRLQVGNGPNPPPVNPGSGGELPVRIFGSDCISTIDLDLASLRLAEAPMSDRHPPRYEDDDGDGLTDVLVRFPVDEMTIPSNGLLSLSGRTMDGRPITGEGRVRLNVHRPAQRLTTHSTDPAPLEVASLRPIGGGLEMRLRGGNGEPMQIDVFDVTGRRLWSGVHRPVGLAEQPVRIAGAAQTSGICFVRVVQGEEVVNRRFAVVR